MRRRRIPSRGTILLALISLISCGTSGPDPSDLPPVPAPVATALEPAVRAQLEAARAGLDAALDAPSPSTDALAAAFGAYGMACHAYTLHDVAVACYVNAEAMNTGDHRWPYYRGHALRDSGAVASAVEAFERAVALAPDEPALRVALAEACLETGAPARARSALAPIAADEPHYARAQLLLGRAALAEGDPAAAVRHLQTARALAPTATEINYSLGLAYRAAGDDEAAATWLARRGAVKVPAPDRLLAAIDELVTGSRVLLARGKTAYAVGDYPAALEALRKSAAIDPDDPEVHASLGATWSRLGRLPEAIASYRQALRLDPAHVTGHFGLASALARTGDDEQAITHYRLALEADPNHFGAQFNLANALRRRQQLDEAALHYRRAIEIEPRDATARLGAATVLLELGRWTDALALLEASHALLPDEEAIANRLARLLAACPRDDVRDGPRALALAEGLVARQRSAPNVEVLAMALAELGRFDEAIDLQQQLLEAVRQAGRADLEATLAANLARYRRQLPCRAPLQQAAGVSAAPARVPADPR